MPQYRAALTAIAHYVPETVYDNQWFAERMDTNDEWITSRTGIKERRIMVDGATSDMILPAARQALERCGKTAEEVDLIIVTTVTPDMMFPPTAAIVQRELGANNAWGYDLSAACSGFLFGLNSARAFVESGVAKTVMVCGADKMSSILNYDDRTTSILFGDGAGVAIVERSDDPDVGIIDAITHIDGGGEPYLHMKAGGSKKPASHETVDNKEHYVYQDGQAVFKRAVIGMAEVSAEVMERNNLTGDDVAWLVPHQANKRIIDATARRMGVTDDKVIVNIDRFGNTTSGTIPICLSELQANNQLQYGDNVILAAFGAGFTWGAIYLKWAIK